MSGFNFGSVATAKSSSSSHRLRAYDIHEVAFDEAKIEEVEIKNGDRAGEKVKTLRVRFSNDNGYFEETLWFPSSDRDFERTENQWGGQNPSNFDRAKMFVVHVLGTLNPEGLETFRNIVCGNDPKHKAPRDFDEFIAYFIALVNKAKGVKTKLKLVGRNSQGNIQPALPFFCAVNKDGEEYIKDNFLGDNVAFSAKELQAKAQFENTKPTPMNDSGVDAIASSTVEDNGLNSNDLDAMLNSIDTSGL